MDPKENRNHQKRLIIVTLILFITSLIYVKLDSLIEILLRKEIFINDEHNEYTRSWMNPPVPINFDIYVFSIANPGNVFKKSKPKLKEYGPFSYDMKIEKEILSFSADQKIVKFYDIQSYYFKYGQSKGQLFQQVYVINFPAFAMASMVHSFVSSLPFANGLYPVVFGMLNAFFGFHRETAIKKLTVGQLLHGYRFEILDTMDKIAKPLALFGISLPDTGLADNKFGILWSKNLTRNGPYQVFTGRDDTNVLEMNAYKGKQNLEFYDESSCNALNGTEGSALGLNVERHDYYIFQDDLCRSMKLTYVKDNWVNGIKTYRFIIDKKTFSSPEKNYENRCFCTDPSDEDFCDGVLNLFPCLKAPFGLSFPHLLYAGSKHKNSVLNLNPIVEKHLTFVEIEPFSGNLLKAAQRLQMNALIHSIPFMGDFKNFKRMAMPFIWFEKSFAIDDKLTRKLQMTLYPLYSIYILINMMLLVSIILFLVQSIRYAQTRLKMRQRINQNQETLNQPLTMAVERTERY